MPDRLVAATGLFAGSMSASIEPSTDGLGPGTDEPIDFESEINDTRRIRDEALSVIRCIFSDAMLGRSLEQEKVCGTIDNIIESIFRNRHALTGRARFKSCDDYTFAHSVNVCILSIALGRNLELSKEDLHAIGIGAFFHDIGKILLPVELVNKLGSYSPAERIEIERQPYLEAEFISGTAGVKDETVRIVSQHHEKYDGTGYQIDLKGKEIHPFARMAGLTDRYDAMTTDRVCRRAIMPTEVLHILYLRRNEYFGPGLVDAFIKSVGIYPIRSLLELNTGEAGIVVSVNRLNLLKPMILLVIDRQKRLRVRPFFVDLAHDEGVVITGILDPKLYGLDVEGYPLNGDPLSDAAGNLN